MHDHPPENPWHSPWHIPESIAWDIKAQKTNAHIYWGGKIWIFQTIIVGTVPQEKNLGGTDYSLNDQLACEILNRWKVVLHIRKQSMKEGGEGSNCSGQTVIWWSDVPWQEHQSLTILIAYNSSPLTQHVMEKTHNKGHWPDFILSKGLNISKVIALSVLPCVFF